MYSLISYRSSFVFLLCITCLHSSLSFAQERDAPPPLLEDGDSKATSSSASEKRSEAQQIESDQEEKLTSGWFMDPLIASGYTFAGNAVGLGLSTTLLASSLYLLRNHYPRRVGDQTLASSKIMFIGFAPFALIPWAGSLFTGALIGAIMAGGDKADHIATWGGLLAGQLIGTGGFLLAGTLGFYATLGMISHLHILAPGKWNPSLQDHLKLGSMQATAAVGTIASTALAAPIGVLGAHTIKTVLAKNAGEPSAQAGVE